MINFVIPFPAIDPVAIELGPLVIRWYALAYIVGILIGWRYAKWVARREPQRFNPELLEDFLLWATLGVVLGGRLGFVFFYGPYYFLHHPLEAFQIWQGGMSFHGGILGVAVAVILFARRHRIPALALGDAAAAAAPIGLFFGRIANFINGELWGRPTDLPWAMVFPHAGPEPRHPSQLYEAGLEGILLFGILLFLIRRTDWLQKPGAIFGVFLIGYGVARSLVELVRDPSGYIGPLTTGQFLSLPMIIVGAVLLAYALRRNRTA